MNNPTCPYCPEGVRMVVQRESTGMVRGVDFMICPKCFSRSPAIETVDGQWEGKQTEAYAAAMQRWVEPNRVLTADEVTSGEIVAAWEENKRYPIDLGGWTLCSNEGPVMEHYGKTWRMWLRRPTDEERESIPCA